MQRPSPDESEGVADGGMVVDGPATGATVASEPCAACGGALRRSPRVDLADANPVRFYRCENCGVGGHAVLSPDGDAIERTVGPAFDGDRGAVATLDRICDDAPPLAAARHLLANAQRTTREPSPARRDVEAAASVLAECSHHDHAALRRVADRLGSARDHLDAPTAPLVGLAQSLVYDALSADDALDWEVTDGE